MSKSTNFCNKCWHYPEVMCVASQSHLCNNEPTGGAACPSTTPSSRPTLLTPPTRHQPPFHPCSHSSSSTAHTYLFPHLLTTLHGWLILIFPHLLTTLKGSLYSLPSCADTPTTQTSTPDQFLSSWGDVASLWEQAVMGIVYVPFVFLFLSCPWPGSFTSNKKMHTFTQGLCHRKVNAPDMETLKTPHPPLPVPPKHLHPGEHSLL